MIFIISPAKTLDFENADSERALTLPEYLEEANEIANEMKGYSPEELEKLMKISAPLAELNYNRYKQWQNENTAFNKAAIFAFKGDVYRALDAHSLNEEQLSFTREHLRILSGLYGIIKPYDKIMPYRLEMGTPLKFKGYTSLYEFWGYKLTEGLSRELMEHKNKVLVNLASEEYSKAVHFDKLPENIRVVHVFFKEFRNGKYKIIGTNAKRARGYMSRYIIENSIDQVESLKDFSAQGYEFNAYLSDDNNLIFTKG